MWLIHLQKKETLPIIKCPHGFCPIMFVGLVSLQYIITNVGKTIMNINELSPKSPFL